MPVAIIAGLIVISFMICVVALWEESTVFGVSLFVFVGLTSWLLIAQSYERVELSRIDYVIHDSPDGYQYVTIDNEPVNLTKKFGKMVPDGYKVQGVIYDDVYCGVNFVDRSIESGLEIVKR